MNDELKLEESFLMAPQTAPRKLNGKHAIFALDSGEHDDLSPSNIEVLAEQLRAMGGAVVRLEKMIRDEVVDLKTDQIARMERRLEKQEEELRELRDEKNRFTGGAWILYSVIMGLGSILGTLATTFGLRLFGK